MRFSLKWLLFGTAYVALVAGAFVSRIDLLAGALGSSSTLLADTLWAVTLCVVCYAFVVACFGKQDRRPAALGFALLASAHIVGLNLVPARLPAAWALGTFGYYVSGAGDIYVWKTRDGNVRIKTSRPVPNSTPIVQTANAFATMIAGLIGAGIGALAYSEWSAMRAAEPVGHRLRDRSLSRL